MRCNYTSSGRILLVPEPREIIWRARGAKPILCAPFLCVRQQIIEREHVGDEPIQLGQRALVQLRLVGYGIADEQRGKITLIGVRGGEPNTDRGDQPGPSPPSPRRGRATGSPDWCDKRR